MIATFRGADPMWGSEQSGCAFRTWIGGVYPVLENGALVLKGAHSFVGIGAVFHPCESANDAGAIPPAA